jgi:hypothetical protein
MTAMPPKIPRLENGDRLTADEFMRRYEAMPGVRAQLIGGIVYIASPLRAEHHGDPHAEILGWLMDYKKSTPGVRPSVGATVRLSDETVPEPDASLRIVRGGRTRIEGGYIVGGPELVVEIAGWRDPEERGLPGAVARPGGDVGGRHGPGNGGVEPRAGDAGARGVRDCPSASSACALTLARRPAVRTLILVALPPPPRGSVSCRTPPNPPPPPASPRRLRSSPSRSG